jgi:hypothetical protein
MAHFYPLRWHHSLLGLTKKRLKLASALPHDHKTHPGRDYLVMVGGIIS